jgi:hypothetical protein
VAGKNQVIFAPVNGRTWEKWKEPQDLPVLPDEFLPYDRKSPNDVLNCLSWQVGKEKGKGTFGSYEELLSCLTFLEECGLPKDLIEEAFQLIFPDDYDPKLTEYYAERTRRRLDNGAPVIGTGSFFKRVKELGLGSIERFARELQSVTRNTAGPKQEGSKEMAFTALDDLLAEPDENVSWVLDGILPSGGPSVIAGKPKAGKSVWTRNLIHCVVMGLPFLGRSVEQGPVLYCAFEEKRGEVRKHFRLMGTKGPLYLFINVAPPDAIRQLEEAVVRIKPVLVVIDTLFKLCRIKDGNDYSQAITAIEPLLKLARESGAHLLTVHHAGKGERQGGDSILGSTGIFATVDTAIILKRGDKYRTVWTIQRYGDDLEETTLQWDAERKMVSPGKTRQEEDLAAMEEAMLQCLQMQEQPLTEAEIDAAVEGRKSLKVKALRSLVTKEKVEKAGKGGKTDPFRYSCSLVPDTYSGTTKQEPENGGDHNNGADYSCSVDFPKNRCSEDFREQEKHASKSAGGSDQQADERTHDAGGNDQEGWEHDD